VQIARVIGHVVASVKDPRLTGAKLLLLQPVAARGEAVDRPRVALDSVGAGAGEHVMFVRGTEAAYPFHPSEPPTDATIVGIVDRWNLE
jgi:ethanolamine utilization protein EutN